ncbi:uncharacterized protein LOC121867620 isoform X2 [Homarus americanus]|uniref:uncharacterized protein LOC121867620 isoform X2 n=1 Tax=Homarus americanus TaxID=6706 RepID=UPI001C46D7B1|nr:uncharacterized protein LOC121867620 isoform X2 [Homarus americanus]
MKILAAICVLAVGVSAQVGHSGIVRPDGVNTQFSHAFADDIALVGPSGIVTKSGQNVQLTSDLHFVPRAKRSAGMVSAKGNIGHSGILRADGTTDLFSHDLAHDILLIGPSGVVTKSGRNLQLTDDLRIVNPRTKRSVPLVGPSGMITAEGIPIQFSKPGTTILLDGPSGYVMSDGTLVQKRSKRHLVGESGIITSDGQQIQLEHGVKVVLAGPSGILLSNGKNIQL